MALPAIGSAYPKLMPIAPSNKPVADTDQTSNEQTVMPYTCNTCARRKVRCDKYSPTCGTCRRVKLECVYQDQPPRKRPRVAQDSTEEKLKLYEHVLKQNGLLGDDGSLKTPYHTSTAQSVQSSGYKPYGKLLAVDGKSRYIESMVWQNLDENSLTDSLDEVGNPDNEEQLATVEQAPMSLSAPPQDLDPVSGALISTPLYPTDLVNYRPSGEMALKLFKIYLENVEPLCKLVHVPSAKAMIERAVVDPASVSRTTETLLFAIYHFAVVSLSDEDCHRLFDRPKEPLREAFHAALCQALVNASVLQTSEVIALQAYTLFLLSVRITYDPNTFWILCGVAMRIAQRLGIHRDGEKLGLNPFDTEMRRRIFGQLIPLDSLASQMCSTGIHWSDSYSTKSPRNLHDEDIWPNMAHQPVERTGATDMIFYLTRAHLVRFHREVLFGLQSSELEKGAALPADKDVALDRIEDECYEKYLRYCDPAVPIQALTLAMGRGAVNAARLHLRLPRAKALKEDLPESEKYKIWELCNKTFNTDIAIHNNLMLRGFRWHVQALLQWDPLIWVLNEICRASVIARQDDEVWDRIDKLYAHRPELLSQRRVLHRALWKLTLQAWTVHVAGRDGDVPEPEFISRMRMALRKREPPRTSHMSPAMDPALVSGTDPDNTLAYDPVLSGDLNFEGDDWNIWDHLMTDPGDLSGGLPSK